MGMVGNVSSLNKYRRVEEWDPEEKKHREAQFLIYKTLQKADGVTEGHTRKPSWVRIACELRVKIGRRLKKTAVIGFCKARARLTIHLYTRFTLWACLFNGVASGSPSPAVLVRLPHPLLS